MCPPAAGPSIQVHAQWAAWANAVAVRELDFHDTFLSVEFGHPGDCIAPIIAVAQQCGCDGETLTRGILVAYEVHVALMSSENRAAYNLAVHHSGGTGAFVAAMNTKARSLGMVAKGRSGVSGSVLMISSRHSVPGTFF